jgi:hypothetical protein
LRSYGLEVWWDYGLEAGSEFHDQIWRKLADARIVVVLWCAESIVSEWVQAEADHSGNRLLPVRLQNVTPPERFASLQSFDLTFWDGSITAPRFQEFVSLLSNRLGQNKALASDTLEDLASLAPVAPLPYEPLSETGGPEFAAWIANARPILEQFRPLYEQMRWRQVGEQRSPEWFVSELHSLVAQLPALPEPPMRRTPSPVHRARLLETLREYMSADLHQGQPIPDSYRIEPIVTELCIRPGVVVTCWSRREGFGGLDTGIVVPLEFLNPN